MKTAKNDPFNAFIVDQLHDLGIVTSRAMFGGRGLYCEGLFFAVLADDILYFKTDATTRSAYLERKMRPFSPFGEEPKNTTYYEVPTDVIEDADQLVEWARAALDVQRRLKRPAPKKSAVEKPIR